MLKTKIICTMGPACDSIDLLKQMIQSGMTVARLNMAHGELEEHVNRMERVRTAAKDLGTFVPIMLDIKGPEIRIGKLKEASVTLETGKELILTTEEILGEVHRIGVNYAEMNEVVNPGDTILIDDGLVALNVKKVEGTEIYCQILNGGVLKPRKGVNLPGIKTTLPGVTERDKKHIAFGLENKIEMIAASFVRKAADVEEIRAILKKNQAEHVQIYSKIENQEGVDNIKEIIEASDGVMIARGDLGVEVPIEDVPMMQIDIIKQCNLAGKPVIVATHMLDSMQVNPRPTRAEVSDVSNAVLQGADVVMLSGESAAGKYPLESVKTMAAVAQRAESLIDYRDNFFKKREQHATNITEVISQSAVSASLELNAKVIIASTGSGFTAKVISKYRPKAPILAITSNEKVLSQICLFSGVFPYLGEKVNSTDEMFESITRNAATKGFISSGDTVVLSAGVPIGISGTTNLIKIVQV
ncbi:pyruvate kinase [Paenibacillus gallinarum]|uniref:Pyruvate kinase n=1 Tax=Paenibacillus gallinarum TaxID=2762232 RepID=A0ABR8SWM2_9BACL|nr:pyruvate kinase [Paenibacillus gallinarum]MBD7967891.1 pyruvate kinase [Paenibacillus gallinarum]